jgi:hypothetical protein
MEKFYGKQIARRFRLAINLHKMTIITSIEVERINSNYFRQLLY